MSKNYTQLSQGQRYQIAALVKAGQRQKKIASVVGVSISTISRELRRNGSCKGYDPLRAQEKCATRHRKKRKRVRFTMVMETYIASKLTEEKYSPEIISILGKGEFGDFISHEWIYQWIWARKQDYRQANHYRKLYQHLRHGRHRQRRGHRRERRGVIVPNRVFIDKRPGIVKKRKRLGDYEVDLMIGANHKGALVVITDRATLLTRLQKVRSKDSKEVQLAILRSLKGKLPIHTLTFDNDKAFGLHELIGKKLNAKTYFTRPYCSQDKGTVENRIGVLRRFFPKKTDLNKVSDQMVKAVQDKLNNRPVRKFQYKTPNQCFSDKIALMG